MDDFCDFGTFFHKVRVSKGLPLMSFCRDNHFNVLEVTNIERGRFVPSKTERDSYIRALKLRRGSKAYKKFIELYDETTKPKEDIIFSPGADFSRERILELIKLIR